VVQSGPYSYDSTQSWDGADRLGSGHEITTSVPFKRYKEQVFDTNPRAPQPGVSSGELIAYDPIRQQRVWSVPQRSHYNGGVLSTAGGLLLQGDAEGFFNIRDEETGSLLNRFDVRSGVISSPVTYLVDGIQYVTILVEWGGGQGQYYKQVENLYPGAVYTFKLGGNNMLPAREYTAPRTLVSLKTNASPKQIGRGLNVFLRNCVTCHGQPGAGGGTLPDLARSNESVYSALEAIVLKGALQATGMPEHSAILGADDIVDLRAYLIYTAQSLRAGITPLELNNSLLEMQRAVLEP